MVLDSVVVLVLVVLVVVTVVLQRPFFISGTRLVSLTCSAVKG